MIGARTIPIAQTVAALARQVVVEAYELRRSCPAASSGRRATSSLMDRESLD
jgi:hypothetical protein